MSDPAIRPFTCAGVGLKVYEYLCDLDAIGYRPSRVVSYRQATDVLSSFDLIAAFCSEREILLDESQRPSFGVGELVFFVGWQYLINESPADLIVLHDSLLPRYRGFAPTVTAMINGDNQIGVTALRPVAEVDAGPVLGQIALDVIYPMPIAEALRRQAQAMSRLTIDILKASTDSVPAGTTQAESEATYSVWRDRDDYWLDWSLAADRLARTIDAVGPPYEGARSLYRGQEIIIREAKALPDLTFEIRQPGKVWKLENGAPVVICGNGLLKIVRAETLEGDPVRFDRLRTRFANRPERGD